ncbi:hypothetical protein [Companilactobacillus farciminis]|uniref:hypothetical protein n=1 Tax=Companilactobacillus farciminis TaxID=1612 RepID=UPI00232E0883|nr:hypothetical protein [Companilactobacillus farciminis]WCG35759.1 hypothetical protein PML84_00835 [Companilactobacillus farciminis]
MNLIYKLFYINIEGLGWKFLFYIAIIFISLFFWFKENRYQYKDYMIREVTTKQFNELRHKIKVDLQYGSEDTTPINKIWIFGSKDFPSKVSLFEFDSSMSTNSNWEEKAYRQIKDTFEVSSESFVAFNLIVPEGLPTYKVKVEMNGMTAWVNISDQLRYDVIENKQNRIKFKQSFISFLKGKIAN